MQDDDPPSSFDPKTWGRAPGGSPDTPPSGKVNPARPNGTVSESDSPPKAAEDGVSFDPRSWGRPATGKLASAAPPPPPPPPEKPTPPRKPLDTGLLIALGVSAVILVTGGITAKLSYQKPAPAPETVAMVQPAAPASPAASSRVMTLASIYDLPDALMASGLGEADAQAAAQALLGALGAPATGEVRLAVTLSGTADGLHLDHADIAFADSSGATLTRNASGEYAATPTAAALKTVMIVKRGEIDTTSFYSSAVTAGITDSLIPDFAKAFYYDFDFQREINPGDVFEAAFEQTENASGEPVGAPRLVYASLTTAAKSKALYFFQPKSGDAGWFDGNGRSIIKSFMRTPIDGAHITSQFGIRVHPVLGFIKAHKGTDFGAPVGTPIYAAGDGTVTWAAMKGPNGNLTIIQHDNGWQTYYLHQSAFAPGISAGVRVHQGETIGYVGTTGRSTGPHLHYEMHIDGEAVDAMKVPLEDGHALTGDDIGAFFAERDRIDTVRAQQVE